jgi:hypothetical protein
MYLLAGTFREAPQQTHRWNNTKLKWKELEDFDHALMVRCKGRVSVRRWWGKIPIFHMPIFGGWKHYVVIQPLNDVLWHPGWIAGDVIGVSRITIQGPVRLLLGDKKVAFYGVDQEGNQIRLAKVGEGKVGDKGPFSRIPLL